MNEKKILITNIGNRNLKVNGRFIVKNFNIEDDSSFRDQTKMIWGELQKSNFTEKLEPAIINDVIEKEKEELEKVIFISSDMPDIMRNDQDTIYEGEILCYILKQKYPGIHFVNLPVDASVFIHDQLFKKYRSILVKLKTENKDRHILYCDAGGTSQQKFAMKISIEYLFQPDQFTVYYVAQEQKGISKILTGESYEYRKIVDLEHALQAINSSSYMVASDLLSKNGISSTSAKGKLLFFLDYRLRLFFQLAHDNAKQIESTSKFEVPIFIHQYIKKVPAGNYKGWEESLNKDDFFQLCEILIASQWKYLNNQIEQAIHFFAMFYENYLLMIIEEHFGYKVRKNYDYYMDRLITDIKNGLIQLPVGIQPVKGIPLQIVFTEQLEHKNHLRLLKSLRKLNSILSNNSSGVDKIRNDYAHRGKSITKEAFEKMPFFNHFINCFSLFGIDFNRNYYEEMHNEVCEIIRKS